MKIKDDLWMDNIFVDYTYTYGTVEEKEDGFYVGARKLWLLDYIYLLKDGTD